MSSELMHANHRQGGTRQPDHDMANGVPAEAAATEPGQAGFAVVPPYPSIQRYASDDELGGTEADAGITGSLLRRKGAGRPLDQVDADRFAGGFGADLSSVRVHTDGEADSMARSVQSVAFTYGKDVYFTQGSYSPGTDSGDHLLAHELAHVVQGSSGRWGTGGGSGVRIGRADDPAEVAADEAADQVMAQQRRGTAPDPAVVGSLPAVQGEPIARTVRRAGLKSLAKKVFKGKKKDRKTRPDSSPRLGGASIAELKAASDAAHAARHKPTSSGSSSSGPERERRSSSHSSRHRDEAKMSDHSGEGAESESEENGAHYSQSVGLLRPPEGYAQPGSVFVGGADSESSASSGSEEEAKEEENGAHYSQSVGLLRPPEGYAQPGSVFVGDADSESSESEGDDDIFGAEHSLGGEDEAKGAHYNHGVDLLRPPEGYSRPGSIDLGDADSESESEGDDDIFGAEPELRSEDHSESSESEAEEQVEAKQKKTGHRAFLIRNLPASFADETKSGKAGMEIPIGYIVQRITRARAALTILEGGGTVAAAMSAIVMAGVVNQLKTVGEDTNAALTIVRNYLNDQMEFIRRQDLPISAVGALGDVSTRKVHYDAKDEQAKSLVTAKGGKLYRAGGEPVDTAKSSTFHSGNGVEVFVASATGEIHMASHQIGQYHHSSLLAGDQVSVGGEMKVTGGKIDWISNKSGHYMPTQQHLVQFVHWLGKDGIDLKSFIIRDGFGFQGGMSAEDFVAGVDEKGAKDETQSFHALKLAAVLTLYKREEGRADVEDFLESKGWEDFGDEVVDEDTMETIDAKTVIAALKKKFGELDRALEKM